MRGVESGDDHKKDPYDFHDTRLSGREPSGENATKQDDGNHERQRGVRKCARNGTEGCAWATHACWAKEIAIGHQPESDHQAWYDTGHEQTGNRHVADGSINDGRNAGWHKSC